MNLCKHNFSMTKWSYFNTRYHEKLPPTDKTRNRIENGREGVRARR